MNRKLILLCLVILLVFSSISSVVLAEEEGAMSNILNTFERIFGFIPKTLEKLWGADASAIFLAKLIIWILLYSALYYGLAFFKEHRGTRIAVSVSIALMGAALIPAQIILNIYITYTVIGSVLVLAIPFIFGWFLIGKLPKEKGYNYIRVFIYILLIFVLFSIRGSISDLAAKGADKIGGLDTFDSLLSLFMLVCIIGIITNLFRGFTGRDVGSERFEWGEGAGRAWNWLTTREEEETEQEEAALRSEERDERRAERDAANLTRDLEEEGAPAAVIREVSDIQAKLRDFREKLTELYKRAKIAEAFQEKVESLKKSYAGKNVLNHLEAVEEERKKIYWNTRKGVELAIDADRELGAIAKEVEDLEGKGLKSKNLKDLRAILTDMRKKMDLVMRVLVFKIRAEKKLVKGTEAAEKKTKK